MAYPNSPWPSQTRAWPTQTARVIPMIPTYTTFVGLPKICLAFDWPTQMKIPRTAPDRKGHLESFGPLKCMHGESLVSSAVHVAKGIIPSSITACSESNHLVLNSVTTSDAAFRQTSLTACSCPLVSLIDKNKVSLQSSFVYAINRVLIVCRVVFVASCWIQCERGCIC